MCGIAGIVSLNTTLVHEERLVHMTDAIAHRGPDGSGHWINPSNNAGLGHRRLAIIDLSDNASQPMHLLPGVSPGLESRPPRYTITYNGEIYNYIEIRETLQKKGYRFHSQSDTEVILAAYDYWKKDCVLQFDGMFSFAIWDDREKLLFAARDRFGEKPFHYYEDGQQFVFASEMKALWAAGVERTVDNKMLLNYLTLGYLQNPNARKQTFFQQCFALPPAHYLQVSLGDFRSQTRSYWNIDKETTIPVAPAEAIERFTGLLRTSVARRLRSDVSVGISLSGGLDSSSIAATIQKLPKRNHRLQTFSAVFPGFERDESLHIQTVVKRFNLQNIQTVPSADGLIDDFERLCHHQEEPLGSSSVYAQFRVFQLAREHRVKVLLDGQGADETQAGYNHYIHWYLQQLLSRNHFREAAREKQFFRAKGTPFNWSGRNYLAAFLPSHASIQLERNEYRKALRHTDIHPEFILSLRGREWEGIHKPIVTKLNDILYFHTCVMGLSELLRYADRNSMAHGREVRLPFLNHELVEFLFSLPAAFKIHEGWTKWLLRQSMSKHLPAEIVWRHDKVGYETPQRQWMQEKRVQEYIRESRKKLVDRHILKPDMLNKKILPLGAHEKDNFDWRYLCAAQIL